MSLTRDKHFETTLQVYTLWPFVTLLKNPSKREPPVFQGACYLHFPFFKCVPFK